MFYKYVHSDFVWSLNAPDYLNFAKLTYLGYCFHSAYHSSGFAYESASALIEYFVKEYDAKSFTAGTALDNIPSCRLLEKLYFVCVSTETVSFDNDFSFQGGNFVLNVI